MSREQLIEEIRRVQRAVGDNPRSGARGDLPPQTAAVEEAPPAPADPRPPSREVVDRDRATLRNLLSELASRLDRTQEQLLARIAEVQIEPEPAQETTPPERQAILGQILARLERLGLTESRVLARLDELEERLEHDPRTAEGAPPVDLTAITAALEELRDLRATGSGPHGDAEPWRSLDERLENLEDRLGGDAGAMTLGAAVARLGEGIDRISARLDAQSRTGSPSGPPVGPPVGAPVALDENDAATGVPRCPAGAAAELDAIPRAIANLKLDVGRLVRMVDGHLQDSRRRADHLADILGHLRSAFAIGSAEECVERASARETSPEK